MAVGAEGGDVAGQGEEAFPPVAGGEGCGQSRLFQVTVDRKRAEQDATLLANRIALLKMEEQKAAKKVTETNKRTREIVDLRHRNEEAREEKEAEKIMQEKELDDWRDALAEQRDARQRKLQSAVGATQAKKLAMRDEIRSEKRVLQHLAHAQMEEEYAKAASRRDRIRTAALQTNLERQQKRADKQAGAGERLELRIATEQQKTMEKEDAILEMERQEVELIQRLQTTQQRQRAAYERLEEVLQQPHQSTMSGKVTPTSTKFGESITSKFSKPVAVVGSSSSSRLAAAPPPTILGQAVQKEAPPSAPGRKQQAVRPPAGGATGRAAVETKAAAAAAAAEKLTYVTADGAALPVGPEEEADLDFASIFA